MSASASATIKIRMSNPQPLWRRRRQRLALLDDVGGDDLRSVRAALAAVHGIRRNIEALADLIGLRSDTLDIENEIPFEHVVGLRAGMGVAGNIGVRRNL